MAKAWIHDKWLKSAQDTTADGHRTKMELPPSAKHSLAMFADEVGKAKVPDEFKSKDYGKGARWEVRWRVDGTGRPSSSATGPMPRRSGPRSRIAYGRTGTWTPRIHTDRCGRQRNSGSRGWQARSWARPKDTTGASCECRSCPNGEMSH